MVLATVRSLELPLGLLYLPLFRVVTLIQSAVTKDILQFWAIHAHFSKDQNSSFKLLVLLFNNECYRGVSYEEIDIKNI